MYWYICLADELLEDWASLSHTHISKEQQSDKNVALIVLGPPSFVRPSNTSRQTPTLNVWLHHLKYLVVTYTAVSAANWKEIGSEAIVVMLGDLWRRL